MKSRLLSGSNSRASLDGCLPHPLHICVTLSCEQFIGTQKNRDRNDKSLHSLQKEEVAEEAEEYIHIVYLRGGTQGRWFPKAWIKRGVLQQCHTEMEIEWFKESKRWLNKGNNKGYTNMYNMIE